MRQWPNSEQRSPPRAMQQPEPEVRFVSPAWCKSRHPILRSLEARRKLFTGSCAHAREPRCRCSVTARVVAGTTRPEQADHGAYEEKMAGSGETRPGLRRGGRGAAMRIRRYGPHDSPVKRSLVTRGRFCPSYPGPDLFADRQRLQTPAHGPRQKSAAARVRGRCPGR